MINSSGSIFPKVNCDDLTDKKMSSIQKKSTVDTDNKLKFETPKEEFFKRIA